MKDFLYARRYTQSDAQLLEEVLAWEGLSDEHRAAFADMAEKQTIERGGRLSEKQRKWLETVADWAAAGGAPITDDGGVIENLASSGKIPDPGAKHAELDAFLREKKPLKPPPRRDP